MGHLCSLGWEVASVNAVAVNSPDRSQTAWVSGLEILSHVQRLVFQNVHLLLHYFCFFLKET